MTLQRLLDYTISPLAWLKWIPETVQNKIPLDTKVAIACIDDEWVIYNQKGEIFYSELDIAEEFIIEDTDIKLEDWQIPLYFAHIEKVEPVTYEPPPKRYA